MTGEIKLDKISKQSSEKETESVEPIECNTELTKERWRTKEVQRVEEGKEEEKGRERKQ